MKGLTDSIERFRKLWEDRFNKLEAALKKTTQKNNSIMKQERKKDLGKKKRIIYWTVTILLALGMFSGGIGQLIRAEQTTEGIIHLGYPKYFMSILGPWKILGAIAILIPKFQLLKEWAYAGLFFAMSGAVVSHIVSGDGVSQYIAPLIFAVLTLVSWYFRPADRKIISNNK